MSFAVSSLNFSNAREVLKEGLEAIARGEHECDLGNLVQVDSTSVAVLLAWQRAALENRSSLRFLRTPASLVSLATLYGVDGLLSQS